MRERKIEVRYFSCHSMSELDSQVRLLVEKSIDATQGSYSPYSDFQVGAAVLLTDGSIVLGANQENAAYPSGLCAERTAIFSAHSNYPNEDIVAIAIAATFENETAEKILHSIQASPCGACCQVMIESELRAKRPIKVIIASAHEIIIFSSVKDLLPFAFSAFK